MPVIWSTQKAAAHTELGNDGKGGLPEGVLSRGSVTVFDGHEETAQEQLSICACCRGCKDNLLKGNQVQMATEVYCNSGAAQCFATTSRFSPGNLRNMGLFSLFLARHIFRILNSLPLQVSFKVTF